MIDEILYGPTYYSQFSLPAHNGVTITRIDCRAEASVTDENLLLSITASFFLDDLTTSASHEVLKSRSLYKITATGILNEMELYEVYEHTMVGLLRGLHRHELNKRIKPTKDLHPLTPDELSDDIRKVIDIYYQGTFL